VILQSLPPTGNPISAETSNQPLAALLPGYQLVWLDSGTSALAFSLEQLKWRYPGVSEPEVIIPGYCCPDLLSAALFAGFTPKVVDICDNDPSYDLPQLEAAITANTLAVVAINFLGIAERLTEIQQVISLWPKLALIEDNAQWFPDAQEVDELAGDYVIFSFGRGKAVSLLGGGLVAVKEGIALVDLQLTPEVFSSTWFLKVKLLSFLTQPWVYYWVEKLTFLKLGATVYHPLEQIRLMSPGRRQLVFANIVRYRSLTRDAELALSQWIFAQGNALNTLIASERCHRLIRFPVLVNSPADRTRLIQHSGNRRLGLSRLYNSALSEVEGVKALALAIGPLPNATRFAQRLVTFPTHQQVKQKHLLAMASCAKSV
jgi:dTDP-4-amino-4,6-dideoxygalactose transaminase